MHIIMHEILLDHVAFITKTNNKIIKAILAVDLHDMPKNGLTTYFYHRFWTAIGFFTDPGAQATCKNYYFHDMRLGAANLSQNMDNWSIAYRMSTKVPFCTNWPSQPPSAVI